jgi:hypothetical protein
MNKQFVAFTMGINITLLTMNSCWALTEDTKSLAWILEGIAMVESGRGNTPWPWTLNVDGKPYFFIDRESAWNAAQRLISHHYDHFDIGIMQVNWHFHHRRFKSTWDALDPKINQRIAEDILREEWQASGHLPTAIARYHSANPKLGLPYLNKVLQAMSDARKERPQ